MMKSDKTLKTNECVTYNSDKEEKAKYVYYTDGTCSIRIPWNQEPPDGFVRGRIKRKFTDEERVSFVSKVRATKQERYGDANYNNVEQNKKTKLIRYGQETYNNREKSKNSCMERYGVSNPSKSPDVRVKISNALQGHYTSESTKKKISDACIGRPVTQETVEKGNATKRRNKSFNTSKAEENLYLQLCEEYGVQDVERNYSDSRYPFKCDFYIKSIDLFIELNRHWTHGKHPYNSDSANDQKILLEWKEKAKYSKFYQQAIYVWTVLDVHKIQVAKENNLNYKLIY